MAGGNQTFYGAFDASAGERVFPVLLQLTDPVRARLRRFLNRQEFVGMRPSDIIDILLDREEIYPENIHSYAAKNPRISAAPDRTSLAPPQDLHRTSRDDDGYENAPNILSPVRNACDVQNQNFENEQVIEECEQNFDEEEMLVNEEELLASEYAVNDQVSGSNSAVTSRRQYRKRSHPERKGVGTGKQKPWTSHLRRYLYDIIVKWQRDDLLHCRECDRWMRVVHKRCGLRCGNALDHVCNHFGKPVYACRLCSHKTVTSVQMRKHLKQVHDRVNDFDDLTESYYCELADRISTCFDYTGLGEPPMETRRLLTLKKKPGETGVGKAFLNHEADVNSSSVRRFVYDLIAKWQAENAVYCRHCDHWVRIGTESSWAQTQAALAHICGHYGKALYSCLICEERTITCNQMIRHIRHVHQTISRGNCLEEIDNHQSDLKDMAAKCFDWPDGHGPPPISTDGPFLKKRRVERAAKEERPKRTTENPCRREILEYGRRLIKQFSRNSRKMKCQGCNIVSVVKSAKGEPRPEVLLDHALRHMNKDAYGCPHCNKTTKRKESMRLHLIKHKDSNPTDYVDKISEMKELLLEKIRRCYDQNIMYIEGAEGAGCSNKI